MTEKRVMKLASRGKRFGAACIDAFVPVVSYLLYSAVMAANGIRINNPGYGYGFGNDFGYGYGYGFDYGNGLGSRHLTGASTAIMLVVFIILLAYIIAQLILFSRGKSIGKAILGLQVVSSTDGKPFRFWKMVFRECFVKSASGSVFGLGYIWILLDEKNRGWHDKILDSYVVDLKESERMNYIRHMEQARRNAPPAETAPAPAPEPEIKETEPVIPEVQQAEEPVVEVVPEVVITEAGEAAEEPEVQSEEPEAVPELSMSMKKEELLAAAREKGIQISARATKAAIIEAIEKAEATDTVEEKEL
jgi:uncharacterized RDD family membrane protein YckC